MFYETGAVGNLAKLTEKHLCWNHFLIKHRGRLLLNVSQKITFVTKSRVWDGL